MGLINPSGPSFAHWTDNFGTPVDEQADFGYGVGVVPGTSNSDGSAVTLLSALAHDCEYLILGFNGFGEPNKSMRVLADILIDPAGGTSWSELIADLLVGHTSYGLSVNDPTGVPVIPPVYHFPLWLPAGTSIGVRARTASTTALAGGGPSGPIAWAVAAGGNKNPASWWCGQKVETIGAVPASSAGTSVAIGVDGTWGSWTNVGSASAGRGGAVQFMARGTSGTSANNQIYRYEFGIGGGRIGPPHYGGMHGDECCSSFWSGPVFLDVPSGTQFQARGVSGHGTGNALDCCVYVVQ